MRCAHASAVPVESVVTGEVLAALCPGCDTQLPAAFLACSHENVIDITNLSEPPGQGICNDCGTAAWFGGRPTALITLAAEITPEDLEAFKARFLVAQREPYRTLFLPYVASLSAPTPSETT
ncbi:hypothetical protein [Nonomuraea sp. NPDC049750]|uniref:hypothetical protein n=1 Tax=Nonomuraea sp. NPDC049750 TaxID=3154738 RepID=UPI0033C53C49